jgi:hypothetical protein
MDSHVRNDPKIRQLRGRHGAAGLGNFLALVSYIATEGSRKDPGVGVNSTGLALDLTAMAFDLDFATPDALRDFLTFLATVSLIEADAWAAGIVILPAMRKRAERYRQSKGRTRTGRPVGRPKTKTVDSQGNGPATFPDSQNSDGSRDAISGPNYPKQGKAAGEIVEIVPEKNPGETPGNCGVIPGNSGKSCTVLLSVRTDQDLLRETSTKIPETSTKIPDLILEPDPEADDGPDPRIGKLTVKKLVRLWNLTRTPGPKVLGVVPARYERFRMAIRATPDAATWETAIGYLNGVAWANAPGGDGNTHANFRADLDYLAKPGNVTKALERLAAAALPKARPARHTGRIMDSPERRAETKAARLKRDADEDEELKRMGL